MNFAYSFYYDGQKRKLSTSVPVSVGDRINPEKIGVSLTASGHSYLKVTHICHEGPGTVLQVERSFT